MDIHDWHPANLGGLAHVYNAQIAATVPHCYPVTPEELQTDRHFVDGTTLLKELEQHDEKGE